jgi:hypothetical protein
MSELGQGKKLERQPASLAAQRHNLFLWFSLSLLGPTLGET